MKTLHKKCTPNITVDDALIDEWKTLLDATIRRALDPWLNHIQGASGGPQAQGDAQPTSETNHHREKHP